MEITPVRLPETLIEEVDSLVKKGYYSSKSDVIRDAVRRLLLDRLVGIIPNTGDSVKEVRAIRKKLSKQKFDVNKLNKLLKE